MNELILIELKEAGQADGLTPKTVVRHYKILEYIYRHRPDIIQVAKFQLEKAFKDLYTPSQISKSVSWLMSKGYLIKQWSGGDSTYRYRCTQHWQDIFTEGEN